mmetsp:Transcript_38174/g.114007  ORF Transcript_38174/g.114007 Transcript_38174/m.114007 type:complete len:292 (-) Transcript_38174:826-1701(-)
MSLSRSASASLAALEWSGDPQEQPPPEEASREVLRPQDEGLPGPQLRDLEHPGAKLEDGPLGPHAAAGGVHGVPPRRHLPGHAGVHEGPAGVRAQHDRLSRLVREDVQRPAGEDAPPRDVLDHVLPRQPVPVADDLPKHPEVHGNAPGVLHVTAPLGDELGPVVDVLGRGPHKGAPEEVVLDLRALVDWVDHEHRWLVAGGRVGHCVLPAAVLMDPEGLLLSAAEHLGDSRHGCAGLRPQEVHEGRVFDPVPPSVVPRKRLHALLAVVPRHLLAAVRLGGIGLGRLAGEVR